MSLIMLFSSHFITIIIISYFLRSGAEATQPLSARVSVDSAAVAGPQKATLATCTVISEKTAAQMSWRLGSLSDFVNPSSNNVQHLDGIFTVSSSLIAVPTVQMNQQLVQCVITHDTLKTELEINHRIIVHYPPQLVFVTPFNDPSYAEVFQCEADANPPATDFRWHSNKDVTIPNDAIEIKGNKLYFLRLSSDLNGVYFCNASNMYGTAVGSLFWHQGKKKEDYHPEL
ncbi:nectin-1 [Danio aesculapii]|uniref:nectin-1 n=1 Tax=Danio aesculapii TaxID=1142201 RepID=UPI0024BF73FF|nr:nectin-1 [Danio aesculapii]